MEGTGSERILVYSRADNLAVAGVLDIPGGDRVQGIEEAEASKLLENLGSLLLAVEYGSIILVYEGLGMPAPIGRLAPIGDFTVSTGCPAERRPKINDSQLLKMWAHLVLGQREEAFAALPSGCLPLKYPPGSCLSVSPLFDCHSYMKARPAPTGKKVKLPPYLKGRV